MPSSIISCISGGFPLPLSPSLYLFSPISSLMVRCFICPPILSPSKPYLFIYTVFIHFKMPTAFFPLFIKTEKYNSPVFRKIDYLGNDNDKKEMLLLLYYSLRKLGFEKNCNHINLDLKHYYFFTDQYLQEWRRKKILL